MHKMTRMVKKKERKKQRKINERAAVFCFFS